MRRIMVAFLLSLAAAAIGCRSSQQAQSPSAKEQIKQALDRLLSAENDEAFVVIEHKPSGKFVQFAVSARESLVLDLPFQILDDAEKVRAKQFFAARGIDKPYEGPLFDRPGGKEVGTQYSWQMDFKRDTERAADTAMLVFGEVFLLSVSKNQLVIEESN